MDEMTLRNNLIELLKGASAHVSAERALEGVKAGLAVVRPSGMHSIWEHLEHMRLAQEDILRYATDPNWKSPPWPDGYWPAETDTLTDEMWMDAVKKFFADLDEVAALAQNTRLDLTSLISHGEGHTYLREILLVADHNSYHLGQIVHIRKTLGDWPE
ncbi:MAG: DinB family protein [Acidobacteriota bacterium]